MIFNLHISIRVHLYLIYLNSFEKYFFYNFLVWLIQGFFGTWRIISFIKFVNKGFFVDLYQMHLFMTHFRYIMLSLQGVSNYGSNWPYRNSIFYSRWLMLHIYNSTQPHYMPNFIIKGFPFLLTLTKAKLITQLWPAFSKNFSNFSCMFLNPNNFFQFEF